ncbi:MAG: hypothetical protein Q8Q73_12120 [Stagnimonas sp.]|nr:hypothetical protein [Stagnimonas sp.]
MERNLASILALAGTAAISVTLAALAPSDAYADDISIDNATFTSSRSRAEIRAELLGQPAAWKMNAGELALQYNHLPPVRSVATREQVKAEYKASREYVNRLLGEDSGSSYFARSALARGGHAGTSTTTMGGPSR